MEVRALRARLGARFRLPRPAAAVAGAAGPGEATAAAATVGFPGGGRPTADGATCRAGAALGGVRALASGAAQRGAARNAWSTRWPRSSGCSRGGRAVRLRRRTAPTRAGACEQYFGELARRFEAGFDPARSHLGRRPRARLRPPAARARPPGRAAGRLRRAQAPRTGHRRDETDVGRAGGSRPRLGGRLSRELEPQAGSLRRRHAEAGDQPRLESRRSRSTAAAGYREVAAVQRRALRPPLVREGGPHSAVAQSPAPHDPRRSHNLHHATAPCGRRAAPAASRTAQVPCGLPGTVASSLLSARLNLLSMDGTTAR